MSEALYHSPAFGVPVEEPARQRVADAIDRQRRYFTPREVDAFELGYRAGEEQVYKTKRGTVAKLVLDGAIFCVCLIILASWALQIGGYIEEGATDRQHQATIERLEKQLAAIDARLGITSDKMEIRAK